MKKALVLCLMIICVASVVFGQLKVANDFGQDLNVSINGGQKIIVKNKEQKTFSASGRSVSLDCATLDGRIKFSVSKNVTRSGFLKIESSDNPVSQPVSQVQTQTISYSTASIPTNQTQYSSAPGSLSSILKGEKTSGSSVMVTNVPAPGQTSTQVSNIVYSTPQNFEKIHVIYEGSKRFKVFSDLGGSKWQGIEFRGKENESDTLKDNAKNEYDLFVQKDIDLHIGVVFNPEKALNEYGEFRKRINREDATLYIKEGDIKMMSTDKKKSIRIKLEAKGYSLYFTPDEKDPVSLRDNQMSRYFMAPIGQFYLKASCTDENGMFHPTVYIPIHVANSDNHFKVTTKAINKAFKDLNLDWSKLK